MKRIVVLAIVLLVLLCSCASKSSYDSSAVLEETYPSELYNQSAEMEYAYDDAGIAAEPSYVENKSSVAPAGTTRKLIKTATRNLETLEFDTTVAAIEKLCVDYGGYVENSDVSGNNYSSKYYGYNQRYANYTLRIPVDKLDAFLDDAGNIGNVTYKSDNARDITDAYYDTEARLKAVETRRDRLMELLEKADSMETIIQLEQALSDTMYEIDSYTGTLRLYDNQVDYSFVYINITEVFELSSPTPPPPVTLGSRLQDAGINAVRDLKNGTQDFVVWIVRNVFTLIILAAIVVALVIIVRRIRHKKKNKSKSSEE